MAFYATALNAMNDTAIAYRLIALATKIVALTRMKYAEAWSLCCDTFWISSWRDSHDTVLNKMERGYQSGMECGDFELGLLARMCSLHHEYCAGFALGPIDKKFEALLASARSYKTEVVLNLNLELRRKIQYLIGCDKAFDATELAQFGPVRNDGSQTTLMLTYGYLSRTELGLYFGELEFAKAMVKKLMPVSEDDGSYAVDCLRLYFSSLVYACLALRTSKSSHVSKARKFCRRLKKLCEIRGKNSWHRVLIMQAQIETLKPRVSNQTIETSFDKAIHLAKETGYIQDVGLASHLAGEYFKLKQKEAKARKYLALARDSYHEWGATALVIHLEEKHDGLITALPKHVNETVDKWRTDIESLDSDATVEDIMFSR